MFCGTFRPEEYDEEPGAAGPCSTPKRYRGKDNRNPYSDRGRDRFEALLADLDERRRSIYSQSGCDGISLVRFSYTSSNDCVPIVIKQKEGAGHGHDYRDGKAKPKKEEGHVSGSDSNEEIKDVFPVEYPPWRGKGSEEGSEKKNTGQSPQHPCGSSYLKAKNWRRPSSYMPAAIVLILLLLALCGRSLAILCISMGWYAVPVLQATEPLQGRKSSTKKKEPGSKSGDKTEATRGEPASSSPRNTGFRHRTSRPCITFMGRKVVEDRFLNFSF
ncbi:hypothetical protein MLD38_000965 [Melastoma candidum]|uniref:Uncharacterized protein n=1 Tax=Melastoma candidum TaxID=119954 RepID=A0ACB9SCM8_9MYRT|nr:hypothetical protein MLD38_000965 [Melastoma candidum]